MRDRTILTLLRWYYVRNPRAAMNYCKAQTKTYGIGWVIGRRVYRGKLVR